MLNHVLAIGLAYVIDLLIGDPKNWPHPVKWMGSFIQIFERRFNQGKFLKIKGIVMLVLLLMIVFGLSFTLLYFTYKWHPAIGVLLEGILLATTIAQKGLKDAAIEVVKPLETGNITIAREKLSYIVGRDTEKLSEEEIVRGTVETVAENICDGITSPLFWAFIGGAPLALVYRAVNTCDSMVGYKNKRYQNFGWASARFDDIVNWIPARLTGFITMLTFRPEVTSRSQAFKTLFSNAKKHLSPNSGWGEASVAALLGIQLGGVNFYEGIKSHSPPIGKRLKNLEINDIHKTITIMQRTVLLFVVILVVGGLLYELAITWC